MSKTDLPILVYWFRETVDQANNIFQNRVVYSQRSKNLVNLNVTGSAFVNYTVMHTKYQQNL